VTLSEQRWLEEAARKETFAARVFPAGESVAENFGRLCEHRQDSALRLRLQMLDLFTQAFEQDLAPKSSEETGDNGAKARLKGLLKQMHPADMLELNFRELAAQVGCCPRHLGRLFEQAVGMTFREKQAQVRLGRAQELLATTNSKVVEVALESGYQSLSLFNLMFKKRFGVTPAQWRERPYRRSEARLQTR
jgi:transcriptional regulator GlxA family with amidase domain